ncbi:MAG: DNA repair protein RecN [Eubacteriales bacterium]|nr:DNA repair protein RecN [Eubacteriales bacterium]
MLQNLHVKNLALIDEIEVEFGPGLNIMTGETGAGKSIILGSVNLALGGRYSRDILRKGAQFGLVELAFVPENEKQLKKLEALDIYPEDGMILLSRRLMDGRSTSRINGETVTMSRLKEAAGILIDIHGQHEHQSLLYKKNQLLILDAFAGEHLKAVAGQVKDAYKDYRSCLDEWKKANLDEAERAKEASFLEFEIREIEQANLAPGEDEQLEQDYRRMNHARSIMENAAEAYELTGGSGEGASDQISRAIRCMSDAARYDGRAEELYRQLSELEGLLNDFNRELSDYQSSLEFSEEEFHAVEERLNEINHLKTKYGNSIDQILKYCEEKSQRLQMLNDYEGYLLSLQENLKKKEEKLKRHTEDLSRLRKGQGKILERAVEEALQELNFVDVKFEIQFAELEAYTANGKDDVEFLISMNPGEPVKPLAEVASGGELSRTMLAIKAVMADKDQIETLIFDEIDVGISGRTAQKVSEKMAVIGRSHQVICITHLAQIAAMADTHYVIEKTVTDGSTRTGIRQLAEEETTEELARILGGAEITGAVRENAREMKELAKDYKTRIS